jgi:hypothetical protein
MTYGFPPDTSALRKFTDWFPGVYNASSYAPAVPLDGGTAVREGVAVYSLPLVTLSLPLQGILFCLLVAFIVSYAMSSWRGCLPNPDASQLSGICSS